MNHWLSLFVGNNYKYPAVQMHEIGHNINLAHSGGLDGRTYTDHTCLMGNPLFSDDVGKMCFNPAKIFQISRGGGWYDNSQIIAIDSGASGGTSWSGKIIGVAEYDNTNDPIVVKLESGSGRDWFIGFNRANGPNSDNVQADDLVTIYRVTDGDGLGYSTSSLLVTLRAGQSVTISNWRNTSMNLVIKVNDISTESSPGYAQVEIAFGGAQPPDPGHWSSLLDWLASLPPGATFALLLFCTLFLSTSFYLCFYTTQFFVKRQRNRFDDESYSGKLSNKKGATNLSHVGQTVHAALQRYHPQHRLTMWNVTSGKVIGQVHNTPRNVWDAALDPIEGNDDWFPEKLEEIISRTEAWCDIMSLGPPDGKFLTAFQNALQKLAYRSMSKDGNPIVVRILLGSYPPKPLDCSQVIKTLTKNLPEDANLHIWVGAWRKGFSWNHAKLIAVDGVYLHTGKRTFLVRLVVAALDNLISYCFECRRTQLVEGSLSGKKSCS